MSKTTTPPSKGLAPNEYNGLIHAIWLMDRKILETTDQRELDSLHRYRNGLSSLFIRIA